jgi:hypothetical protein
LQKFTDITNGTLNPALNVLGNSNGSGVSLFGLLPYNGRLIIAASIFYTYTQYYSHASGSLDISNTKQFSGFFGFDSNTLAGPRALGGALSLIPKDWQSALGGIAFTGQQSMSVISTTSVGPSLTLFDPDDVGKKNPIPGKTLLFYSLTNPLCGIPGCDNTGNSIYNGISTIRGRALVPNTKSILFIGSHSVGDYWYGNNPSPTGQYDSIRPGGYGPHSTGYEYRIWAYDANDLVSVNTGKLAPHEVKPYRIWALPELTAQDPTGMIGGAGYDPETNLIFVTTAYGVFPRVDVYKIDVK